jgi:hypothetical protein
MTNHNGKRQKQIPRDDNKKAKATAKATARAIVAVGLEDF